MSSRNFPSFDVIDASCDFWLWLKCKISIELIKKIFLDPAKVNIMQHDFLVKYKGDPFGFWRGIGKTDRETIFDFYMVTLGH
jgi:hypothetical protein